jgi:hypothetical protein
LSFDFHSKYFEVGFVLLGASFVWLILAIVKKI